MDCRCFSSIFHVAYRPIPMSPSMLLDPTPLDTLELLLFSSLQGSVNLSLTDDGLAVLRRRKCELKLPRISNPTTAGSSIGMRLG